MQPALGSREEKRAFYKMTFRITLPIALQNLMDACVNSADVVMLALVGQNELSASILMLLTILINTTATLVARYFRRNKQL